MSVGGKNTTSTSQMHWLSSILKHAHKEDVTLEYCPTHWCVEAFDKTVTPQEIKVRLTRAPCLMKDKGSMMNLESPLNQKIQTETRGQGEHG